MVIINTFTIAKKELVDLLENRVIIIVVCAITLLSISILYNSIHSLDGNLDTSTYKNLAYAAANSIFSSLALFSSIISIVIGCTILSSEMYTKSIYTLIVKPVYRHTIINGKFFGAFLFIILLMSFYTTISTAFIIALFGNALTADIYDYITRLLLGFIVSLFYVAIYLSLSILISTFIRSQAFSMIIGLILVYLFITIPNASFALNISRIFSNTGLNTQIIDLSPWYTLYETHSIVLNDQYTLITALNALLPSILSFTSYIVIAFVLSHIIFTRSDI